MELPALLLDPKVQQYVQASFVDTQVGDETVTKFGDLLHHHGIPPLYTTLRVNTHTCSVDLAIDQLKETLKEQYKTKGWPPPVVERHPELQDLIVIPSIIMPQIEKVDREVMVDLSCGMAVLRGADVFVQGILAAPPGLSAGDEVSVYADLERGCRKGLTKRYTGSKVFVGNGVAKYSRSDVFCGGNLLSGVGIEMIHPLHCAPSLSGLLSAVIYPQNLPSVVCGHVLDPQPTEWVLDMCAAPGGKTSHIATLMKNMGRVVAFDKSRKKIPKIEATCNNWKLTTVESYAFDGTKCVDPNSDTSGSPPYPPGTFHRVLVDAPCSALGQRPSLRNHMALAEVKSYPPLQRKLIAKGVELLKPGGILVYSTCTLPTEENEAIVAWALRQFPCLTLVPQVPHLGGSGWPHPGLSQAQCRLLHRFLWPGFYARAQEHQLNDPCRISKKAKGDSDSHFEIKPNEKMTVNEDTIGFFIAKFVKDR